MMITSRFWKTLCLPSSRCIHPLLFVVCLVRRLYVVIYATDPTSRVPTHFLKKQYILYFPVYFFTFLFFFAPLPFSSPLWTKPPQHVVQVGSQLMFKNIS